MSDYESEVIQLKNSLDNNQHLPENNGRSHQHETIIDNLKTWIINGKPADATEDMAEENKEKQGNVVLEKQFRKKDEDN